MSLEGGKKFLRELVKWHKAPTDLHRKHCSVNMIIYTEVEDMNKFKEQVLSCRNCGWYNGNPILHSFQCDLWTYSVR